MKSLSYLAFLTLILSGCGNLYGPYNAPVVDRNIRYNQQPVRNGYQPQNPQFVNPQHIRPTPVPPPTIGRGNTAPPNPYRPAPQQPNGWNVKPQTGNTVVLVDEPKLSKPAPVPAPPVVRKPVEKEPLVDEPKLTPAPKKEEPQISNEKAAKVVPEAPKVAQKPEPEVEEKPKRPAPLRPKMPTNAAEAPVVEKAPEPKETEVATRVPTPAPSGKTAVSSLLKKAANSLEKGKLDEAVAYLQNAQRIEPKNSKILYDIANIRYHQGRYREAENFAGKASQVGGGSMAKKSWRLISKAREALGDKQGALQAAEKAAQ